MKVRAIKPPKYSAVNKSKSIQKLRDEIERKSNEFIRQIGQEPPLPPRDEIKINFQTKDEGSISNPLTPTTQNSKAKGDNCKNSFNSIISTKNLANYSSAISSIFKDENPIANRIYSCNNITHNKNPSKNQKEVKNMCLDIWNSRLALQSQSHDTNNEIKNSKPSQKKYKKKVADDVVKRLYKDKPKYDLDEVMKQKNQIDQELTSFTHSPMINK